MPGTPDSSSSDDPLENKSVEERLRRLQAVTDVELSRMEVEELLPELLERVRELLLTDTAAVLLMDDSEEFLVATAARGLEEEVRQGSRVPLGRGFAGRVAAERRPVIIDEVSPATVVNPVLLMKGIRSMLGVPLLAGDTVLGVLHVGSLHPRKFTHDEVTLLTQAADRAAMAIRARRNIAEAAAANTLQRALAPQRLPRVSQLDLAARYVPGHVMGVGGDWYDVFELRPGVLGIAIGDVMGHGLRAAAVMGRLRTALRVHALDADDPAEVLRRLDRTVQHFEPGQTTTVAYAVFDAATGSVRISSAGHMPPVLAVPGVAARVLDLPSDVLLGVSLDVDRSSTVTQLPPGATLCLYTDGLVERRGEDVMTDLAVLLRVLDSGGMSADEICAQVMATLIGSKRAEDDVALLVLRRTDG